MSGSHRYAIIIITFVTENGSFGRTLEYSRQIKIIPFYSDIERIGNFRIIRTQINIILFIQLTITVYIFIHIITQTEILRHTYTVTIIIFINVLAQLFFCLNLSTIFQTEYRVQRVPLLFVYKAGFKYRHSTIVYQFIISIGKCTSHMIVHFSNFIRPCHSSFISFCFKFSTIGSRSFISQNSRISNCYQHIVILLHKQFYRTLQAAVKQMKVQS